MKTGLSDRERLQYKKKEQNIAKKEVRIIEEHRAISCIIILCIEIKWIPRAPDVTIQEQKQRSFLPLLLAFDFVITLALRQESPPVQRVEAVVNSDNTNEA